MAVRHLWVLARLGVRARRWPWAWLGRGCPAVGATLTPPSLSLSPALKKSFEAEDGDEVPGSPPVSLLPSGTGECHRPLLPGHLPHSGTATGPSPAPSPVLRTRLSTSLSTSRANGTTAIARVASFQTRGVFAAGPGSDGESLRSSSSSLESPAPLQPPGTPPAAGPGLKKVPSHGSVFPVELEHPLRGAAASCGSLPALDLHIAEEPGMGTPLPNPLLWGTRSPVAQPRARQPSSPPAPCDGTEVAPELPVLPKGPAGWDTAPCTLPRPQLRVSLGSSPGAAPAAPSLGRAEGLPPAPQATPFKLVSQPQTVQLSSQPAFLGGLVLVPAPGTLAAPGGAGVTPPTPRGPCAAAAAPGEAVVTPKHGRTRSCPPPLPSPHWDPLAGVVLPKPPGEPPCRQPPQEGVDAGLW